MSDDADRDRLAQAWQAASGDARRDFLAEVLRQQGLRGEGVISITSQVNSRDGSPAVLMAWEERRWTMTPDEAIRHAINVLEVACGAYADAFLVSYVHQRIGAPMGQAAQILMDFRQWRERQGRQPAEEG
jgi:hypothetical protein